jgi:hypothetical protein
MSTLDELNKFLKENQHKKEKGISLKELLEKVKELEKLKDLPQAVQTIAKKMGGRYQDEKVLIVYSYILIAYLKDKKIITIN